MIGFFLFRTENHFNLFLMKRGITKFNTFPSSSYHHFLNLVHMATCGHTNFNLANRLQPFFSSSKFFSSLLFCPSFPNLLSQKAAVSRREQRLSVSEASSISLASATAKPH